jgi:hypothetical protein
VIEDWLKDEQELSSGYLEDILERFRLRDALEDKFGPLVKLKNGRETTWARFMFTNEAVVGRQILSGQIPTKIVNRKYLALKRLERIAR